MSLPPLSATAQTVQRLDPDRFLTALFADPELREDLFALYAFNMEVARIRETVNEPVLGQMRIQWWRDVLEAHFEGKSVPGHPTAQALIETIKRHDLPREPFDTLLEGRDRDMDDRPIPDQESLLAYIDTTGGSVSVLAAQILSGEGDALETARKLGSAYALAGLLRAIPFHASQNRFYLPSDLMDGHGAQEENLLQGRVGKAEQAAIRELVEAVLTAIADCRKASRHVQPSVIAALLPATIAEGAMRRLSKAGFNPFNARFQQPVRYPVKLTWRAWRKRF